jgi:predicted outer membrane repeat protein
LRAAIYVAQSGDTIVFSSLFDTPQTIYAQDTLVITTGVTITGPGTSLLTLGSAYGGYSIVEVNNGTVTISGLTIAGGLHGVGGALANLADLTVSDVIFRNNNATSQGGAIYNLDTLHVDRSTFVGNAAQFGGAVFNSTASGHVGVATITNSTIVGNTALYQASAVASYGSPNNVGTAVVHLQNCTLAGNKGGSPVIVAAYNTGPASLDLFNTIISGNNGPSFDTSSGTANYVSLGNNLSSDGGSGVLTASGDLINTDPLLSTLSNYGGTTPTLYPKGGSPAIDAGSATGAPVTDQRGVTRPQGNAYDIGAVEADGELIFQDGFEG